MNVHRRDLKVMMIVLPIRQPFRQIARMVVENVGERRDALAGHAVIDPSLLETESREIAQRLGAIVVAVAFHEIGEFRGKLVRHANRHPLHEGRPRSMKV